MVSCRRIAALLPLLLEVAAAISCTPSFPVEFDGKAKGAVGFDLESLHFRRFGSYTFRDVVSEAVRNYTYSLNICGETSAPIPECPDKSAVAYQYDNRGECFRLGSTFDDKNAAWSLLNPQYPHKGLKLKYMNGSTCTIQNDVENTTKNRSLTINLICENRNVEVSTLVEEVNCDYTINFPTEYACPRDCPRDGTGAVCGLHGFCGYDSDKGRAVCFCDTDWWGPSCSSQGEEQSTAEAAAPPGCDGVCVSLIFVFLLLIGLIVTAAFILARVRKMNELNIRFAALAEDLNPDGEESFELQDAAVDDIVHTHDEING